MPNQWQPKEKKPFNQGIRFFCGLCKVRCTDQAGYTMHIRTERHQREEELEAERGECHAYDLDDFSLKFERSFLAECVTSHVNENAYAHEIYRIVAPGDRSMHTMAKTCWGTLGRFVCYLRDSAKAHCVRAEKGWKITIFQVTSPRGGRPPLSLPSPSHIHACPPCWRRSRPTPARNERRSGRGRLRGVDLELSEQ